MELEHAIKLLQHQVEKDIKIWADLGCGDGLFTNALSNILPEGSLIYAIDKNKRALNNVEVRKEVKLKKIISDFVKDDLSVSKFDRHINGQLISFCKR